MAYGLIVCTITVTLWFTPELAFWALDGKWYGDDLFLSFLLSAWIVRPFAPNVKLSRIDL